MTLAEPRAALAALVLSLFPPQSAPEPASVGMPVTLRDLVLPGSELEVAPNDVGTPVALRIAAVHPHGDAFRYDLEVWGLEPGTHDVARYLRRVDGSPADDLPEIPLRVEARLAPGQVTPHPLDSRPVGGLGGYRAWLALLGAAWVAGLVLIVRSGRRGAGGADEAPRPATLAERLRPLVESALDGRLGSEARAELELTLIAFWRRKLALEGQGSAEALATLRRHPDAGPLLRALEDWLHRPRADGGGSPADVARLLAPYRSLPADALDAPSAPGGPSAAG